MQAAEYVSPPKRKRLRTIQILKERCGISDKKAEEAAWQLEDARTLACGNRRGRLIEQTDNGQRNLYHFLFLFNENDEKNPGIVAFAMSPKELDKVERSTL